MALINQVLNSDTDLCLNRTATGQVDVMARNMKPAVIHYMFSPKTIDSVATIQGRSGNNSTLPENVIHDVTLSNTSKKYEYGPVLNGDLYISASIITLTADGSAVTITVSEWKSDTLQN